MCFHDCDRSPVPSDPTIINEKSETKKECEKPIKIANSMHAWRVHVKHLLGCQVYEDEIVDFGRMLRRVRDKTFPMEAMMLGHKDVLCCYCDCSIDSFILSQRLSCGRCHSLRKIPQMKRKKKCMKIMKT